MQIGVFVCVSYLLVSMNSVKESRQRDLHGHMTIAQTWKSWSYKPINTFPCCHWKWPTVQYTEKMSSSGQDEMDGERNWWFIPRWKTHFNPRWNLFWKISVHSYIHGWQANLIELWSSISSISLKSYHILITLNCDALCLFTEKQGLMRAVWYIYLDSWILELQEETFDWAVIIQRDISLPLILNLLCSLCVLHHMYSSDLIQAKQNQFINCSCCQIATV